MVEEEVHPLVVVDEEVPANRYLRFVPEVHWEARNGAIVVFVWLLTVVVFYQKYL